MISDRAAGATLYACALALLVGGGVWFVRTAPDSGEDPAVAAGRATVERLLPDVPDQAGAETMALKPGVRTERNPEVPSGSYVVSMLCVGDGQVRVQLTSASSDTGQAVACAFENPPRVELGVSVAEDLFLVVSAETRAPVFFRWQITRSNTY